MSGHAHVYLPQAQQRQRLLGLTAWERHKKLMQEYHTYYNGRLPEQPRTLKTDLDSLVEKHRLVDWLRK